MIFTIAPTPYPKNIIALCLIYLVFQILYIPYAALSVDELWFAHHIYTYTHQLPYRDFLPYKTVLGYYLLSIPFFLSHTLLWPLYYIKDEIAIINTLLFMVTGFWLSQFFNPKAVFYSFCLIFANQLFLIYSVDLRVDMLTSWLGLISVLFILTNRSTLAGFAIALSFLISQKALWFFLATNAALGIYGLYNARHWRIVQQIIQFNVATLIPIGLYVLFWALVSSPAIVLNSVFYEGYTQAKIHWYSQIYYDCWQTILTNGPLLMMLWPLTWIGLFNQEASNPEKSRRVFITSYAFVMLFFIISYQQAFPYNMVYCMPVFLLIYPDFFSWALAHFRENARIFNERKLFWFLSLFAVSIMSLTIIFALPAAYFLIALIPILLGLLLHSKQKDITLFPAPIFIFIIFTGIVYPLLNFSIIAYNLNGHYQQSMIMLTNNLLTKEDNYFAGTPLLYNKDQAIPGLKNLIGPAISYLYTPKKNLLPIMIPSLYLTPRTAEEVIHYLKNTSVKLYVNNYRIVMLPSTIRHYLMTEFAPFWGSIYIYAPFINKERLTFLLKFAGTYEIQSDPSAIIYIDNQKVSLNTTIQLRKGVHYSRTNQDYRLKLIPEHSLKLNPADKNDDWYRMVKPILM